MIYVFSGTGNSVCTAERIAEKTGDRLISLNESIRQNNSIDTASDTALVFCVPTYAWRIPKIVEDWIRRQTFQPGIRTWFVMTCGVEIGNAAAYCRRLCEEKKLRYMGTAQILMPENYLAMFRVPEPDEAERIVRKALPSIDRAAGLIREQKPFPAPRCNLYDRTMSMFVNPFFYALFVKDKAFTAGETCTSCGVCVRSCPLSNIEMLNGKPRWKGTCTHCMACITLCPQGAVEYGSKSIGKSRYRCPDVK